MCEDKDANKLMGNFQRIKFSFNGSIQLLKRSLQSKIHEIPESRKSLASETGNTPTKIPSSTAPSQKHKKNTSSKSLLSREKSSTKIPDSKKIHSCGQWRLIEFRRWFIIESRIRSKMKEKLALTGSKLFLVDMGSSRVFKQSLLLILGYLQLQVRCQVSRTRLS